MAAIKQYLYKGKGGTTPARRTPLSRGNRQGSRRPVASDGTQRTPAKPEDRNVIGKYGTSARADFLEVCSGSGVLTQAVRGARLRALDPVDLNTGWDLTIPADVQKLKDLIAAKRPFLVHFAPDCRIFSAAYHRLGHDDGFDSCMKLALNVAGIARFCVSLQLFVSIENPMRSRIFHLAPYQRLALMAGFQYVNLHACMYGMRHPVEKLSLIHI